MSAAPDDVGLVCNVLGPTMIRLDGAAVNLGGLTQRRTLSLLLAASSPIADERLIDEVWDAPPRDARSALRVVMYRLRRTLGPDGPTLLQRRHAYGYELTVPERLTDTGQFTRQIEHGLAALAGGEPAHAATTLESALRLWRGEPFADVGDCASLAPYRTKLHELRAVATEELLAAQLACAPTPATAAALRAAVSEAPYRERRWELLALALYRSGRQVEALDELRRVRDLLIADIGVEPGPALRDMELRILAQDPDLLVAGPTTLAQVS